MKNREYFNLLRVTDNFPKGNYNRERFNYLLDSEFEIDHIHRKFEDSGEFNFLYTVNICYKWAKRFKKTENFDMRIVDKMIGVAMFRREVLGHSTNSYFENMMLSEDFIENSVDEVLRFISIFEIYNGLAQITLGGRKVNIKISQGRLMLIDSETLAILGENVHMIVFKGEEYKFIKKLEKIKREDYDFVLVGSKGIRKYIQ